MRAPHLTSTPPLPKNYLATSTSILTITNNNADGGDGGDVEVICRRPMGKARQDLSVLAMRISGPIPFAKPAAPRPQDGQFNEGSYKTSSPTSKPSTVHAAMAVD